MRVSDFDDFDRFETEGLLTGNKERSWLWFGLIVSLAIHFALCAYFYRTRFQSIETMVAQNEQTPTFKVRSINASDLGKSSVEARRFRTTCGMFCLINPRWNSQK
ncbi:MAG: hypothetical protein DMF20_05515 [Verrucomicrobia bacterium]|nr:MAG: hypothetical protein DMF20_05515 [Verrucomicrobiota bacterium]